MTSCPSVGECQVFALKRSGFSVLISVAVSDVPFKHSVISLVLRKEVFRIWLFAQCLVPRPIYFTSVNSCKFTSCAIKIIFDAPNECCWRNQLRVKPLQVIPSMMHGRASKFYFWANSLCGANRLTFMCYTRIKKNNSIWKL